MRTIKFLFVLFVSFPLSLHAQSKHTLSTPYPSKEAVALYAYINDMFGKRMLSGQMESSWGIEEMEYIEKVTGKLPAIRGMDFINNKDNNNEVQDAIRSEEHTSELQSRENLVCRLLLEKKKK